MGFLLNDNAGYGGPNAGAVARGQVPYYGNHQYDVGGQLQSPYPQPEAPTPLFNEAPQPHPLATVGSLLNDHAHILRQRLYAAQLQNALPPQFPPDQFNSNPLSIIQQTRKTGSQNLAQLLARFHRHPAGNTGTAPVVIPHEPATP